MATMIEHDPVFTIPTIDASMPMGDLVPPKPEPDRGMDLHTIIFGRPRIKPIVNRKPTSPERMPTNAELRRMRERAQRERVTIAAFREAERLKAAF